MSSPTTNTNKFAEKPDLALIQKELEEAEDAYWNPRLGLIPRKQTYPSILKKPAPLQTGAIENNRARGQGERFYRDDDEIRKAAQKANARQFIDNTGRKISIQQAVELEQAALKAVKAERAREARERKKERKELMALKSGILDDDVSSKREKKTQALKEQKITAPRKNAAPKKNEVSKPKSTAPKPSAQTPKPGSSPADKKPAQTTATTTPEKPKAPKNVTATIERAKPTSKIFARAKIDTSKITAAKSTNFDIVKPAPVPASRVVTPSPSPPPPAERYTSPAISLRAEIPPPPPSPTVMSPPPIPQTPTEDLGFEFEVVSDDSNGKIEQKKYKEKSTSPIKDIAATVEGPISLKRAAELAKAANLAKTLKLKEQSNVVAKKTVEDKVEIVKTATAVKASVKDTGKPAGKKVNEPMKKTPTPAQIKAKDKPVPIKATAPTTESSQPPKPYSSAPPKKKQSPILTAYNLLIHNKVFKAALDANVPFEKAMAMMEKMGNVHVCNACKLLMEHEVIGNALSVAIPLAQAVEMVVKMEEEDDKTSEVEKNVVDDKVEKRKTQVEKTAVEDKKVEKKKSPAVIKKAANTDYHKKTQKPAAKTHPAPKTKEQERKTPAALKPVNSGVTKNKAFAKNVSETSEKTKTIMLASATRNTITPKPVTIDEDITMKEDTANPRPSAPQPAPIEQSAAATTAPEPKIKPALKPLSSSATSISPATTTRKSVSFRLNPPTKRSRYNDESSDFKGGENRVGASVEGPARKRVRVDLQTYLAQQSEKKLAFEKKVESMKEVLSAKIDNLMKDLAKDTKEVDVEMTDVASGMDLEEGEIVDN